MRLGPNNWAITISAPPRALQHVSGHYLRDEPRLGYRAARRYLDASVRDCIKGERHPHRFGRTAGASKHHQFRHLRRGWLHHTTEAFKPPMRHRAIHAMGLTVATICAANLQSGTSYANLDVVHQA